MPASRSSVEAKFKTIKQQYDAFKNEYGPRLESDWNAIASEIAFGKGEEKFARVDEMLDGLERRMAKVRGGE